MNYIKSKENNFFKLMKKMSIKKYRDEERTFLVEGIKLIDYIDEIKFIIVKESKTNDFLEYVEKNNCFVFSNLLFDEISSQNNSQGIILVLNYLENSIDYSTNEIVVLDNIQDPGNLGTLIRLVDAVGIKNIILTKGTCDIYNEKVVRSTMGSLFNVNIEYFSLNKLSEFLLDKKFNVLVTALEKDSISYDKMTLKDKNAIIFGNEGHGVSSDLISISNEKLIISIYGKAESLNVGIAAGVFLYKYIEKNRFEH